MLTAGPREGFETSLYGWKCTKLRFMIWNVWSVSQKLESQRLPENLLRQWKLILSICCKKLNLLGNGKLTCDLTNLWRPESKLLASGAKTRTVKWASSNKQTQSKIYRNKKYPIFNSLTGSHMVQTLQSWCRFIFNKFQIKMNFIFYSIKNIFYYYLLNILIKMYLLLFK